VLISRFCQSLRHRADLAGGVSAEEEVDGDALPNRLPVHTGRSAIGFDRSICLLHSLLGYIERFVRRMRIGILLFQVVSTIRPPDPTVVLPQFPIYGVRSVVKIEAVPNTFGERDDSPSQALDAVGPSTPTTPTLARAASGTVTPLVQCLVHYRQQLRPPLLDALMADSETAQQHDLAEIPQCQPVAERTEHQERDDVARQRCSIEDTVAALVELLAVVSPDG
jgi:hypothetical protein